MKMLFALLSVGLALGPPANATRGEYVDYLNSLPGTWKAGVNARFADKPLGYSKRLCGVKNWPTNELDKLVKEGIVKTPTEEWLSTIDPPESFDSETNWPNCAEVIGDIRDQSDCGCCWAFGAATAASDRLCIATKGAIKVPLSAQATCFCAESNGCNGGSLFTPWSYIKRQGVVTGGQYQGSGPFGKGMCSDFSLPHCHHHGPQGQDPYPAENTKGCPSVKKSPACPKSCDSGSSKNFASDEYSFKGEVMKFPSQEKAIRAAIAEAGPVEVAFSVYKDFENYVSGIYTKKSNQMLGGHAVTLVGWGSEGGVDYWKVQNSWNPYWGEKGYFRIKRGTDECGIESSATAASNTAVWGKKADLDLMN